MVKMFLLQKDCLKLDTIGMIGSFYVKQFC